MPKKKHDSKQTSLFETSGADMEPTRKQTLHERFEIFHKANPHIYRKFVSICREWKRCGRDKGSIAQLIEAVRWSSTQTDTTETYKISNDYKPLYARLIMKQEPGLAGMFNLRPQRKQ